MEEEISNSGSRDFNDEEFYRGQPVYKKAEGIGESLLQPFKVSEDHSFFGDIQGETRDQDPDYRMDEEAPGPK